MRTAFIIVAFALTLFAQKTPVESDFVGEWKLVEVSDPAAGKLGSILNVTITKNLMTVEESPGIAHNKKKFKRRIDMRGKTYPNESLGGPTITKAYWEGDSVVVFEKMDPSHTKPGSDVTRTETWTLSNQNQTLTIKTAYKNLRVCDNLKCTSESLDYDQVFERQD